MRSHLHSVPLRKVLPLKRLGSVFGKGGFGPRNQISSPLMKKPRRKPRRGFCVRGTQRQNPRQIALHRFAEDAVLQASHVSCSSSSAKNSVRQARVLSVPWSRIFSVALFTLKREAAAGSVR